MYPGDYIYITVVPPNTAVLGTGEKPAVFRNGGIRREYNLKNPIWDLKWAVVLGGRRSWEGGGIGRGSIGRDDCIVIVQVGITEA